VLYTLWLKHADPELAGLAMQQLSDADADRAKLLMSAVSELTDAQQLMLFDGAVARLHEVSDSERTQLVETYQNWKLASQEGNVFHWMWNVVLDKSLNDQEERQSRCGRLDQVAGACEYVLSMMSHIGPDQHDMAGFAFQRGLASLGVEHINLRPVEECTWEKFEIALEVVGQLTARPRREILVASTLAMTTDQEITPEESYALRGICRALGYDMPSVLPGQPLAVGV